MNELFATVVDSGEVAEQGAIFAEGAVPAASAAGYRVLARKYRPSTFDQLIGQEAMVRTLANAIASGRLPHAWMLTGVRGIGKTTTARIIARALNCTGPDSKGGPTITPCGQCDACRSIAEDRNVDVMELDAASHTGVDDMREIIEGVRYGPAASRYKIYILDEVHMLSKNAFNALLKTLEEPPPHTKFIFATTEIRKVPVTVLSRCQRFDLRRIESDLLAKHFADVAKWEQVEAEPEALRMVAHAADGSVRDGLSLLDQAIARGNGAVTAADVKDMLGLADRGQSMALCRDILRGQVASALDTFSQMQLGGSDPMQILQDMGDLVHMLTRGQAIPSYASDSSLPEYDRKLLIELADLKIPALTRAWQILLKGITEVHLAPHPAHAAEMVLIRMAYAADLPTPGELVKKLKDMPVTTAPAAASPTINNPPPSGAMNNASAASGGNPPARAMMAGGGSVGVVSAVAQQVVEAKAAPQADVTALLVPSTFAELVALFSEHREAGLHATLFSMVRPVRCEPGLLEINFTGDAPGNLAARISKCLMEWTGQRWMVSLSERQGEPSLAERERVTEKKRHDRALAHPLMQAVMKTFPDAKMTALRRKIVPIAEPSVISDEVTDKMTDTNPETNPEDQE